MFVEEKSILTGETYEKPVIHWDEEDKYAIIAFLLRSIDKNVDQNGKVRFDDLFGLNDTAPEPAGEDEEENPEGNKAKRETSDAIVRECEAFLDNLDDTERYDAVVDEIDRFIEGEDARFSKCTIGGTYRTFGGKGNGKLEGGAHRVLWLVQMVILDDDYSGNKRRVLKHLSRKWDLDPNAFPVLESAAKLLPEITEKRKELSESNLPHREVIAKLAELATQEKEIWKLLKSHGVAETLAASAGIASELGEPTGIQGLLSLLNSFGGTVTSLGKFLNDVLSADADDGNDEDEDFEDDDEELSEEGRKRMKDLWNSISAGMKTFSDFIRSPGEFFTDK